MLLDDATLQVPFMADLVTSPTRRRRTSYLNFLKDIGRLYPVLHPQSFYPLRRKYDDYCRSAAERLTRSAEGRPVTRIEHDGESLRRSPVDR